jgi:hypothetical protein
VDINYSDRSHFLIWAAEKGYFRFPPTEYRWVSRGMSSGHYVRASGNSRSFVNDRFLNIILEGRIDAFEEDFPRWIASMQTKRRKLPDTLVERVPSFRHYWGRGCKDVLIAYMSEALKGNWYRISERRVEETC